MASVMRRCGWAEYAFDISLMTHECTVTASREGQDWLQGVKDSIQRQQEEAQRAAAAEQRAREAAARLLYVKKSAAAATIQRVRTDEKPASQSKVIQLCIERDHAAAARLAGLNTLTNHHVCSRKLPVSVLDSGPLLVPACFS